MSVVLFLAGAAGACGRRELANCCNGFRNTPPGWVWREQSPGGALNLTPEDAWRRQGKLGVAPPSDAVQPVCSDKALRDGVARQHLAEAAAGGADVAAWLEQPASFQDIGHFENACGAPLPRDYVEFLLDGKLAAPAARFFDTPADGGDVLEAVQCFFGFGLPWPTCNLDYVRQLYAGGAPDGVIPIAGNGAGDYICLDLRGGGTARAAPVALWRIAHFWRSGEWREQDFTMLSSSFAGFLAGLRHAPRRQGAHAAADAGAAPSAMPVSDRQTVHQMGVFTSAGPLFGRWSA